MITKCWKLNLFLNNLVVKIKVTLNGYFEMNDKKNITYLNYSTHLCLQPERHRREKNNQVAQKLEQQIKKEKGKVYK